jgi:hypothetical protein
MLKKNWLTTVIGLLTGVSGATMAGWFNSDGSIHWAAVLFAALAAVFGAVAKTFNVTGGTVPLTKEAETRTEGANALPSTK